MPTKNLRINVVLEKPVYTLIEKLAREQGISLSLVTRDLISDALEVRENIGLDRFAAAREASLAGRRPLSPDEVWG